VRFAGIGLDHRHVYEMTAELIAAGMACAGHCLETTDPRVLAGFRKRFPTCRQFRTVASCSRIPRPTSLLPRRPARPRGAGHRGGGTWQQGDVGRAGMTRFAHLAEVERTIAETVRIWSICPGRLTSPAVREALRFTRAGEMDRWSTPPRSRHIGSTARCAPPDFDRVRYGGIINDIGSHAIDRFLAFAGTRDAEVVSSTVGRSAPSPQSLQSLRTAPKPS
jgi:hypothetical protein